MQKRKRTGGKWSNHKLAITDKYAYLLEFRRPFFYGFKENKRDNYVYVELSEEEKKKKKDLYRYQRWLRVRKKVTDLVAFNYTGASTMFITFTYAENMTDLDQGWKDWKAFIRKFNNEVKFEVRYIVVPEFQKRGAVHFHALFFNVPYIKNIGRDFIEPLWGHGLTQVKSQNNYSRDQVSNYLAKYVSKDTFDTRLDNRRGYATSRNIIRPHYENDIVHISELLKNWKADNIDIVSPDYIKIKFTKND